MSLADLNFDKGQDFAAEIWQKWGVPINYEEDKDMEEFLLVAEFTRSQIRLSAESVSTILLSCFGGRASLFKVSQLQNWSFKFSVSSKEVGFSIIKQGNIALPLLNVNFLLWGNGGPNSSWELDQYLQEKADEWTHVFSRHPRKSYIDALISPGIYIDQTPRQTSNAVDPWNSNVTASPGTNDIHRHYTSNQAAPINTVGSPPFQTRPKGPFCVRCLMTGHVRPNCTNKIKCRACKRWGHIARDCYSQAQQGFSCEPTPPPLSFGIPRHNPTVLAMATTSNVNQPPSQNVAPAITPSLTRVGSLHYSASRPSIAQRLLSASFASPSRIPLATSSNSTAMATFPFDPTPFLPPNHHSIEVEGRPARVRVVTAAPPPTHEDWAIVSIVPMPNLPVHFNTIREVLTDFFTDMQLGISEFAPCPFGQAYVKFNSVFDRDHLVNTSPHLYTDVHIVVQKHDRGLNWRRLDLNREAWILLCGFPFDRRNIQEINNTISKFGKFVMWDRVRSTRANQLIKIKVEELSDIPASVVFGNADSTDSLTVPVVILQHQLLGMEAPDEDPIPPHGNPHPHPPHANFHQNQHNHFLGPLQHHEQPIVQDPAIIQQVNLQLALNNEPLQHANQQEELEDEGDDELPGWGHWALPQVNQVVQPEGILEPVIPMDDAELPAAEAEVISNVTISLGLTDSAHSFSSANGPLEPPVQLLADLNVMVGHNDNDPMEAQEDILAQQQHMLMGPVMVPILEAQPIIDHSLQALLLLQVYTDDHREVDPMQLELLANSAFLKSSSKMWMVTIITSRALMMTPLLLCLLLLLFKHLHYNSKSQLLILCTMSLLWLILNHRSRISKLTAAQLFRTPHRATTLMHPQLKHNWAQKEISFGKLILHPRRIAKGLSRRKVWMDMRAPLLSRRRLLPHLPQRFTESEREEERLL
ncbi:uncharacterized protein [Triticum aestivum]|uniref:uncharacterized protein n=1 Tax=Triticum aestivum TaxID=4565 RepID=UPI0008433490|nr:uncharacterized protein LOC123180639 [Triticum aestivum]XP_044448658.1 uncharacterized protein LOC123180639 [Triticum aestivum]